ncbi:glycoside hydrolase family 43 protein [Cellulomonas shaoxiangyii]|uniref:Glycoside hydrolase family 43 protein n=1 Tax=Cellulomonas shaoxiangyii TaxID=2566013 RepID=A0A4P7SKI4_9CELL|nr:glycoside hydrolase family 43 protein [Cellulomonas shaoxiangyii]QCB94700.1 glycoside hydrolase family 43 protein [Cellulomonas shaoxiangyii]TGY85064.1 glycoside hydrolase family 43 protein [Cellulomonas shaoxiangyii]
MSAARSTVTRPEDWHRATNPVLPGFHPDPSVCRVDHGTPDAPDTWFYLVSSTFEYLPGLPVHRSRDLVHWELVGHVVTDQLDYSRLGDSGGLYAPTIRHDGERFLVVCTHLGGPEGGTGNFVVNATDAAGPWSAPVWWPTSEGVDPSLLLDDDGRIWAHGARAAHEPQWAHQGEIWVREVDPATLELTGPETVVFTSALIGAVYTEGPHLYRRGGYVYLVAAEGGTGHHHAVVVARAESPTGPFEPSQDNPALTHRHLGPDAVVVNVGHADLVEAADGSWWALALASRLSDGIDLLGRETFLLPVDWVDDWPVLAPGVGTLVPEPGGPAGTRTGADSPRPHAAWVAVRRLPGAVAELDHAGARATLHAGAGMAASEPAFVGRRLLSPAAVLTLELPDDALTWAGAPGREVGLALRQSGTQWLTAGLRAGADGPRLVVTRCVDGQADVVAEHRVHGAGTVRVRVEGARADIGWQDGSDGSDVTDGSDGSDRTAVAAVTRVDVTHLSTAYAGWFVGVVLGPYALGDGDVTVGRLEQRAV